tara:strand:- start:4534 stop:5721 length:1188 start_codon:yes stop_codon:yes gene_type:complete
MAFPKYQSKEVLNKVLNSGEDALKVDIDNVTLKTEGSDITVEVHTDKAEDSMLIFANTNKAGSGTSYVPLVDSDGHLQVDAMSSALPSGAATAANQSTIIGHVDGLETLITSSNTKLDTLETTLTAIETDAAAIEVLLTAANVDHAANEALLTTIDADTGAIKTAVETIDNAIDGSQMQVDVVAISAQSDGTYIGDIKFGESLPAGSNAIGKLAANSGVDIGDVDVTSLPASTNTIEVVGDAAEDAAVAGNPLLAGGRYDATQRTLDDGDAGALAIDPSGALYTREYTGQDGAVYTTASSDAIKPPTGKAFVAVQMLEDTTFDSTGGLISVTATKWFNTADAAGDLADGSESTAEGSGGKQISNSVTFPQGMTVFGRWNEIDVNSGSVIAYIGDF